MADASKTDGRRASNIAAAEREDIAVEHTLRRAAARKSPVTSTPESIRSGELVLARGRQNAVKVFQDRVERREYISSVELQAAWPVTQQAINKALRANRIFAFVDATGHHFYPSFYADGSFDRRVLEKVSKALGTLPSTSKYHFFTSQFTGLESTPLEALSKGNVEEVLAAASTFAEC